MSSLQGGNQKTEASWFGEWRARDQEGEKPGWNQGTKMDFWQTEPPLKVSKKTKAVGKESYRK